MFFREFIRRRKEAKLAKQMEYLVGGIMTFDEMKEGFERKNDVAFDALTDTHVQALKWAGRSVAYQYPFTVSRNRRISNLRGSLDFTRRYGSSLVALALAGSVLAGIGEWAGWW